MRRIILLTGEAEAPVLAGILRAADATIAIDAALTAADLDRLVATSAGASRLVSFCSSVIVPAVTLAAFGAGAYNFHPGPPEYPGRFPSVFALYDGAARFGITVHEMTAVVDAGPIVAAEWFDIPPGCGLQYLEELTFMAVADKFRALALPLVRLDRPLMRLPYRWSGRKTRKTDVDDLCRITPDLTEDEIARRKRACGGFLAAE
ncbi:MAG: formyltransferase family protein [Rhodospirillaceae bacterium]|nr:formyltransferase family protein [Rhodospirillaceae bacterium]